MRTFFFRLIMKLSSFIVFCERISKILIIRQFFHTIHYSYIGVVGIGYQTVGTDVDVGPVLNMRR